MSNTTFDLLAIGGGVLMVCYGVFVNRNWLLNNSRVPSIVLGAAMLLIGILHIIYG